VLLKEKDTNMSINTQNNIYSQNLQSHSPRLISQDQNSLVLLQANIQSSEEEETNEEMELSGMESSDFESDYDAPEPNPYFNSGINKIAKKRAILLSKYTNGLTAINTPNFGIKEINHLYPEPKHNADDISKMEHTKLKSEALERKITAHNSTIQQYCNEFTETSSTANIRLGFPQLDHILCPNSLRLTSETIRLIKNAIHRRAFNIFTEHQNKMIVDIEKKQKTQQKLTLIQEKKLLENTPEKKLERLMKEMSLLKKKMLTPKQPLQKKLSVTIPHHQKKAKKITLRAGKRVDVQNPVRNVIGQKGKTLVVETLKR
jgi:hypothetical protein